MSSISNLAGAIHHSILRDPLAQTQGFQTRLTRPGAQVRGRLGLRSRSGHQAAGQVM